MHFFPLRGRLNKNHRRKMDAGVSEDRGHIGCRRDETWTSG